MSGPVSAILPGFRLRGGFFTDTSESEEDEEAKEEEEADLATTTGSPLAPSDSGLESESEAEGSFWERPGHGGERADPSTPCSPQPTNTRFPQIGKASSRPGITGSPGCACSCLILHLSVTACDLPRPPSSWVKCRGSKEIHSFFFPSGKSFSNTTKSCLETQPDEMPSYTISAVDSAGPSAHRQHIPGHNSHIILIHARQHTGTPTHTIHVH